MVLNLNKFVHRREENTPSGYEFTGPGIQELFRDEHSRPYVVVSEMKAVCTFCTIVQILSFI